MARTFLKNTIMEWDGHKITDHNRGDFSIDIDRIETSKRMANGTMRKYVIADKRTFSTGWKDLPHSQNFTVDGFWGGQEMEDWYNNHVGAFVLTVTYGDGTQDEFTVMMTDFSKDITKRGKFDFWDVSVKLEEV